MLNNLGSKAAVEKSDQEIFINFLKLTFHIFISFCQSSNLQKNRSWFGFCVIAFKPMKIQTISEPQNDCWNFSFVTDFYVVDEKN